MDVWQVRKPSDLRGAFADQGRTHYIVADDQESEARDCWDGFFETFSLADPTTDPPEMVTTLIHGDNSETIAWLSDRGLRVVVKS